jgi:DNA-binding MarR family transcriptional regulator
MRLPPNDYLKYWRVIRYFIKAKYKITTGELDVLLFLYSEKYFSKDKFNEFDELISWDVNRFDKLLRDGWVVVFRKRQGKKKALYEVSYKGRRMLGSMYKKLSGEEIPESPSVNPMFLKNVSYTDKVYRNMIIEMNKFIRQQRHPSP